jgi:O-acetylserine/cysteine efflux transporter
MKLIDILFATLAACIWGGTWTTGKLAVGYFTPFTLLALRFFIGALVIMPFLKKGLYLPTNLILLFTLANVLNHAGIFVALWLDIDISSVVVLTELSVPFSVLLGVLYLGENISYMQIIGISLAFLGTFYAVGGFEMGVDIIPISLILVSAIGIACSNLLLKSYSNYDNLGLIAYSSLYLSVIFAILAYFLESSNLNFIKYAPISAIFPLLYLAIMPIFAWITWCNLMDKYSIAVISPFQLFVPIFGLVFSYLVLGTTLDTRFIIGLTILCLGHIMNLYISTGSAGNNNNV